MLLTRFTGIVAALCQSIARHGHLRHLSGPLVVLLWHRVRGLALQVERVLARLREGQLRRYPGRRPPRPGAAPRRKPSPQAVPTAPAWLVRLIPETAASAAQLQTLLAEPEFPALLEAAPQLRRALRPLCRMLGVSLPKPPPPGEAPREEARHEAAAPVVASGSPNFPSGCPQAAPAAARGWEGARPECVFTPA